MVKSQIKLLEEKILKAKQAYYFTGTAIMTDVEYDALEETLKRLDPENHTLHIVGAPVPTDSLLTKATHSRPMGSQEKVHSFQELQKWAELRQYKGFYHAGYKADGGSIGLYYIHGKLTEVITRGDGFEGENITANAVSFKGVPLELSRPITCSVRCEAVLTIKDWALVDPTMATNPRNVGNGILGRLDGKNSQLITALAFDVEGEDIIIHSEKEKIEFLHSEGFLTTPDTIGSLENIKTFQAETDEKRKANALDYWIDGVVIKINDLDFQQQLGVSSNRPKGQVAWKFEAEGATTEVLDVKWQVGHTGAVTPVAQVTPVKIGGTTVSNVSLANPELIRTLGVTKNALVRVVKAGDIIPQIIEVLKASPSTPIHIPKTCPVCKNKLSKLKNTDGRETVVLYCLNDDCEARTIGKIKRWVKSNDILGLGESVIVALINNGQLNQVPDLFKLEADRMAELKLSGEKVKLGKRRANSICEEIQKKSKKMSLPQFLGSFGTRSLGVRRASIMIEANPELEDIERWFDGSLLDEAFSVKAGVPQSGTTIYNGLKDYEDTIRATLAEITITSETKVPASAESKTYCITGVLPSGKKKSFYKTPLENLGHKLVDSVDKDLNFLVLSDPSGTSSKAVKAKKLGITCISEDDLIKLIGETKESSKPIAPVQLDLM